MNLSELTKMYDFAGRTVVVTGGTGVLGQAMVRAIVGCGADVALVARNREKAEPQVASLEGPGRAVVFTADVLDAEGLRGAAEDLRRDNRPHHVQVEDESQRVLRQVEEGKLGLRRRRRVVAARAVEQGVNLSELVGDLFSRLLQARRVEHVGLE
ncbi:MAG TPA: SDR family NAD(P)-dependent oxidoreductase, partial [Pyrinomonadaceae bacterium]|nr:SDR family NAD(P)-dependent oxidoreductase [Pyrinomonadaceae bacterium]